MRKTRDFFHKHLRGGSKTQPPTDLDASEPAPSPPRIQETQADHDNQPSSAATTLTTPGSQKNIEEIRRGMWNKAYDGIKADEPKLVEAYERILSLYLKDDKSPELADDHTVNDISQNPEERQEQMKILIEKGLKRTEKGLKIKDTIKNKTQYLQTVNDVVSLALKSEPVAALAWGGIITCLGFLNNGMSEPTENRDGIKYVAERFEWYWELTQLLLDPGTADKSTIKLQDILGSHILGLYKKLLSYQIQSVCLYSKLWATVFAKDLLKVDDWHGKIDSIKKAEIALREDTSQHNSEVMKLRLMKIDTKLDSVVKEIENQTKTIQQIDLDEKDNECMKELGIVNPETHKLNIERTKGGLLKDSYRWILEHEDFCKFRLEENDRKLLWIKGDPGKGKTMLLCGIIDELKQKKPREISYFFCQATESRCKSATSVMRGLIWLLCSKQPKLVSYVRRKYDTEGRSIFGDNNMALISLEQIMDDILQDEGMKHAFLVVDALDECSDDSRDELLQLIVRFSDSFPAKWIVSSRNWPSIEEQFQDASDVRVQLELNKDSISLAVQSFIRYKTDQLAKKKRYKEEVRAAIEQTLLEKSQDTFLWVALVCQDLANVQARHVVATLEAVPTGLDNLYQRMFERISLSNDASICKQILDIISIVKRPLRLDELTEFVPQLEEFEGREVEEILGECGSFLTLQVDIIYFVHQSANDFLVGRFDPSSKAEIHYGIFQRSLDALGELKRDLYDLQSPGILIEEVCFPTPDPWSRLHYSCAYWVDHLEESNVGSCTSNINAIDGFMREKFLHWLEALSLQKKVSDGTRAMKKLEKILQREASVDEDLINFIQDAQRFVRSHTHVIEIAPLQVYESALIFSPSSSLIRNHFEKEADCVASMPKTAPNWDACLQTLEGHTGPVVSFSFSFDGQWLATGSIDSTVKIWDVASGHCMRTLGVGSQVFSIAFLGDNRRVAVGLKNGAIQFWDMITGQCDKELAREKTPVHEITVSPDGKMLTAASGSTISVWDLAHTRCLWKASDARDTAKNWSFSSDAQYLASADMLETVAVWNAATGSCVWTRDGVGNRAVFAGDTLVTGGGSEGRIELWQATTGASIQRLDDSSRNFSPSVYLGHGRCFASSNSRGEIKVWDDAGACSHTLKTHAVGGSRLAFSQATQLLASSSGNSTVKIWDLGIILSTWGVEDSTTSVSQIFLSFDGQWLFTRSGTGMVNMWDTSTGACVRTIVSEGIQLILRVTPDNRHIVLVSTREISVWDLTDGRCIQAFEDVLDLGNYLHEDFLQAFGRVAFSPDSRIFAMICDNSTIKIWDMESQKMIQTIQNDAHHLVLSDSSYTIAFSLYGEIEIWDVFQGHRLRTISCDQVVKSISLSQDHQWLAAQTETGVQVWDLSTGALRDTFKTGTVHGFESANVPTFQNRTFLLNPTRLVFTTNIHLQPRLHLWDATAKVLSTIDLLHSYPVYLYPAEENNSYVCTNMGTMDFGNMSLVGVQTEDDVSNDDDNGGNGSNKDRVFKGLYAQATCTMAYKEHGLSSDGTWVLRGSEKVLWLPLEYRSKQTHIAGSLVAILSDTGRWVLIRLV